MTKYICDYCSIRTCTRESNFFVKDEPDDCPYMGDTNWRKLDPADEPIPYVPTRMWTSGKGGAWYMHCDFECPGCKEKDEEITTWKQVSENEKKSTRALSMSYGQEVMEGRDEIERLNALAANQLRAIGQCHEMIESERAKNAGIADAVMGIKKTLDKWEPAK